MHPPLIHPALQPSSPMLLRSRFMFVIVLLLLIASAKASQGAKTEAPNAPTSQPPSLAALVADAVAREVNVRDRAVAFDRLCQSLAGAKAEAPNAPTSHPPGLAALDTDEFCAEVYFPDGAALKKLL